MKSLGVFLLIIALIFAALASFGVYEYLSRDIEKKTVETIIEKEFYVAIENIPENTMITEKMIKTIKVPENFNLSIYETKKEDIVNKFAYSNIISGEGFAKDRLITNEDTKLILKLNKGERAVSMSVSQYRAVADLIKPGDIIDMYIFLPEKVVNGVMVRENIAKLLLQKLKVLAIKQEMSRNYTNEEKIMETYSVTLAIDAEDVEKLFLGENIGALKLALRGIDDNEEIKTNGEVWRELLVDRDIEKEWLIIYENEHEESVSNDIAGDQAYRKYIVKYTDTLRSIAIDFYEDEEKYTLIKEANGIGKSNLIVTGEILIIPIIED
ncbi:Flp pilus assembly protein CpaB [Clostridiaceae bacterium HSG29]|nr:Flp pilus assembly protein CpaB [Clostridiaceae bacterium HSG29]